MISFSLRYDETLALWQVAEGDGWSAPMRLAKLTQRLHAETQTEQKPLVERQEPWSRPIDHRTKRQDGGTDAAPLHEVVYKHGKKVVQRIAYGAAERQQQQMEELANLLDLADMGKL